MKAIFNREFNSYFNGIIGYAFSALVLLFAGMNVVAINLKGTMPFFELVLSNSCLILIVAIPILTMRSIAEERRQKTDQLLYSLPISSTRIVLGKFFAMTCVLAVPMLVLCIYPVILSQLGPVSFATAYGSILGFFVLGAALISMGLFVSSLTDNQALAAGLCLLVMLLNYFIMNLADFVSSSQFASLIAIAVAILILGLIVWLLTKNKIFSIILTVVCEAGLLGAYAIWPESFYGLFPEIISQLSLFERFYAFAYIVGADTNVTSAAVLDLTALLYFISVIVIFLFLTVQSMEKRRWS